MRLKEIRKKAKMTQTTLAREANISVVYISLLESGKRKNPSVEVLAKIAEALNTTIDELIKKAG